MSSLTPRELEIMRLLGERKGLREIAFNLRISPDTARKHRDNAVRKTGAGSQTAVILEIDRASRQG